VIEQHPSAHLCRTTGPEVRLLTHPGSTTLPIVAHATAAQVGERGGALTAGTKDFPPKRTEPDRLRRSVARLARWQWA
jgi:hypothetical protein